MEKTAGKTAKLSAKDMAQIGMMTALMAVCAWITVPFTIPFTLQTFGVFVTLRLLEGRRGTFAIALYILLGAVGVPVFSGFGAGVGVLAGPTGGYIAGFLLTGILYWVAKPLRNARWKENVTLAVGLAVCYLFGTVWFCIVKGNAGSPTGFLQAISICVLPYLIPDGVKLLLADQIAIRVRKALVSR
jgi:biotin transport system substrate-specific component